MRRLLALTLVSLAALALIPLSAAAAPASQPPSSAPVTVTTSGEVVVATPSDLTVYQVQLMGKIEASDPALTYEGYVAKLDRIRQAVIAAGVAPDAVVPAIANVQPNGVADTVMFNGVFRYDLKRGPLEVSVSKAAFHAGASMVYNSMPTPAVGTRRPEGAALDKAIADATVIARDYAGRIAHGKTVGDALATTLTVRGEPDNAPTQWRVAVTITFDVR